VNAAALNVPVLVGAAEGVAEEAAAAAVAVATDKPDKEAPNKLPETAAKLAATRASRARFPLMKVVGARAGEIREAVEDAAADSKALLAPSGDA